MKGCNHIAGASLALASVLLFSPDVLPQPAKPAAAPATIRIGGETKRVTGRVKELQNGDVSCVMILEDEKGEEFMESGDFEICFQKPSLVGHWIRMSYRMSKVLAESCQGNPDCGKSDTVPLVVKATIIDGPAAMARPSKPRPGPAPRDTHCTSQELEVFACTAGAKVVAVCASKVAGPASGYAQYRFGKAGEKHEMVLPEGEEPAARAATGTNVPFAGGGGAWMRFRKGETAYVVYSGIGRWGPGGATAEKGGVVVEQRGKAIANVKCTGKTRGEMGPDWFARAGVTTRANEDFLFP